MKREDLKRLYDSELLSGIDIHFGEFTAGLGERHGTETAFSAALLSSYTRQGHICLDIRKMEQKSLIEGDDPVVCPGREDWCRKLRESGVTGEPGETKPLVLDNEGRLYLFRYWEYQKKLADFIRERVCREKSKVDLDLLKNGLERLFLKETDWAPELGPELGPDMQKVAAFVAITKRFSVISGGPGTGKTTTVARIMAMLFEQADSGKLRTALVSPTGKGAARLQESLRLTTGTLDCHTRIKEAVPREASTIHRLLGTIPGSPYFRYNTGNRLPLDVVIVDEASMVDLALMSKLVQALPANARLILLGDRDQLSSVEAGAVLGDICDTGESHEFSEGFRNSLFESTGIDVHSGPNVGPNAGPNAGQTPGIGDCIVQLRRSYRFGEQSGIGALSRSVNRGDGEISTSLLTGGRYEDVHWKRLPRPASMDKAVRATVIQGFRGYLTAKKPEDALELLGRFRILCALREGPYGVFALNALVERILKGERLVGLDGEWYTGRPIMITRNSYNLELYNGDVGLILPDPEAQGEPRAFFSTPEGALRKIHPLRLPDHETVFATTVHKSQGSEFDGVLFLLPEKDSPVLTRELLYTGLTRARKRVEIWGTEDIFRAAVSRRTERMSGLRSALWSR